ncbi:hypothetical protein HAX54_042783 [Datura stramonium]|uniref:Membrane-associated kinase regulator 6 n=1 Tax=Datura stramonium TaxID=4076 RepID=A0ABS8W2B5_DATST|nr:hypothetical protein [Datura stramonium]
MENSLQYLASESFSYSWLLNEKKPSSLDEDITLLAYSKRFLELQSQNFNFDVSPVFTSLVHADEIFSDGHIMPLYHFDTCSNSSTTTTPPTPFSPLSARNRGKQRKPCSRRFLKRLKLLWLKFCKSLGSSGKVLEIDKDENANKSSGEVKSWRNSSAEASQMRSPSHYIQVSLDMENTISEAILHCKRSFVVYIKIAFIFGYFVHSNVKKDIFF